MGMVKDESIKKSLPNHHIAPICYTQFMKLWDNKGKLYSVVAEKLILDFLKVAIKCGSY